MKLKSINLLKKSLLTALLLAVFFLPTLVKGFGSNSKDVTSIFALQKPGDLSIPGTVTIIGGADSNKEIEAASFLQLKYVPINNISQPIIYKKGLFLTQYRKLLKDHLKKQYPNAFNDKFVSMYFFRALAENMYSNNGSINPEFFNRVVNGRKNYYELRKRILKLQMDNEIKIFVLHLFLVNCIYTREFDNPQQALEKLVKVPKNPILYVIEPTENFEKTNFQGVANKVSSKNIKNLRNKNTLERGSQGMALYGKYMSNAIGENLYYILASHYPTFVNLTPEVKMKILDDIYQYNPTLTEARPIREDSNILSIIQHYFFEDRDPLLKYRLKALTGWLILPRNLDKYTGSRGTIN